MLSNKFKEHNTLVVSTNTCGYCIKAKSLLEHYNIKYNELKLDEIHGADQMEIANCIYGRNPRYVP